MLYSMHGCIRCFVFPPHLTVDSALPRETGNTLWCFANKHKTHSNYNLLMAAPLFVHKKRSTVCIKRDLGGSIASSHLSLTFIALCVLLLWVCYDVCHWELFIGTGVSQWTTLLGWIVTSTNVNYCLWISIFYFLAWKQVNCCSATFTTSFLLIYDAQQLTAETCQSRSSFSGLLLHKVLQKHQLGEVRKTFLRPCALTLLVGWQEGHPNCKKLSGGMGCWCGYLPEARCRLAYVPANATATHCLLHQ